MDDDVQLTTHNVRELTEEESSQLAMDTVLLTPFKRQKLEKEAKKNWDLFYKRNTTKFFKDRHWTTREFKELCSEDNKNSNVSSKRYMLEVGCGVGNAVFPLIEEGCQLYIYACDFSPRAIDFVKSNRLYDEAKCHAFVCDITCDDLTLSIPAATINIATLIFVLSAITPQKMSAAIANIGKVMATGGTLLFRDYGIYDHAMLRFSRGHKIDDNFYVRQDGTMAYFFSEEATRKLFIGEGFEVVTCEYVYRQTVNKKENLSVPRVFLQGKFKKL
ncbi:uncharacterized protein TRIADDRAFT_22960 [Trichoplax adhaerens]|uniref:tRNA N(3)-methylcytidine methyltransferase n=1 Tax=Trichoplax adhaerens TaxID=10228 RepID=B3RQN2_TRIAD|nr:hypothetical protein TRIADDRAFT_22960 [Trichoplax adhaerens]EDV27276.1 hypothetical protein TRIADDRAFT_22960 [Trichoplax adhaerens]|eukprot:XP_002111272.1 hypothetical protein TRIADDRAFT_22960 [Trichoplax adhaerens]